MKKSIRPRGSYWQCASTFQQGKTYRDIGFASDGSLGEIIRHKHDDGVDDSLSSTECRHLEVLAQKFLNGKALSIQSARSVPTPAVHLEIDTEPGSVWQDVLTDAEYLHAYVKSSSRLPPSAKRKRNTVSGSAWRNAKLRMSMEAHASCKAYESSPQPARYDGPSEEAMRIAAELRHRGRMATAEETQDRADTIPVSQAVTSQHPSSYDCSGETAADPPTAAWTSSKWLNTGALVPRLKGVDEDCSRDELGASSIVSATQRYRRGPAKGLRAQNLAPAASHDDIDSTSGIQNEAGHFEPRPLMSSGVTQANHDVLNDLNVTSDPKRRSTASVQDNMSSGIWPTAGSDSVRLPDKNVASTPACTDPQPMTADDGLRTSPKVVQADLDAKHPAVFIRKRYDVAAGHDSSPFIFRKRVSGSPVVKDSDPTSGGGRALLQRDTTALTEDRAQISGVPGPDVSMDENEVTIVEKNIRTPLLDQHLNRRLPTDLPESAKRSLKRLLLDELISLGAEISSMNDAHDTEIIPPERTAEALHDSHVPSSETRLTSPGKVQTESQRWPGTQFLLAQAKHDLFESPCTNTTGSQRSDTRRSSAQRPNAAVRSTRSARRPLHNLSQAPLPSTQALLDGWSGWSTVKKPRYGQKGDASSATCTSFDQSACSFGHGDVMDGPVGRRSSLRHQTAYSTPSRTWEAEYLSDENGIGSATQLSGSFCSHTRRAERRSNVSVSAMAPGFTPNAVVGETTSKESSGHAGLSDKQITPGPKEADAYEACDDLDDTINELTRDVLDSARVDARFWT